MPGSPDRFDRLENLVSRTTIENLDPSTFDIKFPEEYHNEEDENTEVVNEIENADGKRQRMFRNGKKEVVFANRVRRETFPDGYIIVYFNNGDIKQTFPDQTVVYYFAEAQTTQTSLSTGMQVFKFSNGQIEKHHNDGYKEIK